MLRLFRELLKLTRNYFRDERFRESLRVKAACRNIPAGQPVSVPVAGFTVKSDNASALLHQYEEIFTRRSFDVDFGKNDPLIYCCGANIGLEILFFKKQFPAARIRAFEADPAIAKLLAENVTANGLQDVAVIAAAAWKENGTLSFRPDGALGGKTGEGTASVPAVRLADELAKEPGIDLLIMDIEGAELDVLRDCSGQMGKISRLFVEWHGNENRPQDLPALLKILSDAGFRYRLDNKLPEAPFRNRAVENGFDAMVEIYATR